MPAAQLEHVGIAVASNALERLLADLLGLGVYKTESVVAQGVETRFADAGAKVEFLHALSDESPVAKFVEKRGPGVHHLAFRVDDLSSRARTALVLPESRSSASRHRARTDCASRSYIRAIPTAC